MPPGWIICFHFSCLVIFDWIDGHYKFHLSHCQIFVSFIKGLLRSSIHSSVVEYMLSMCEALCSILSNKKEKEEEEEEVEEEEK